MLKLPLALLLSLPLAAAPAPSPATPSLVAADYGFADAVAKTGIRAGFMGVLRPDCQYFIPRPVNGLEFFRTQLELGAQMTWAPVVAESSQAGDLGYTSGPFAWRPGKDAQDAAFGWNVTLWQREGNGPWKARLEIGIPTPDPIDITPAPALPRPAATTLVPTGSALGNPADLIAMDKAFGIEAAKASKPGTMDYTKVYAAHVDENVRFYRKGHFPLEGVKRMTQAMDAGTVSWEPKEGFVSASGDLGCTRGMLKHDGAHESHYVRMWKKVGSSWKLTLDLELELPAAK
jgi:hypothetical protein